MSRHCTPEEFTALLAEEVGPWRARRLQRHIAACEDCRTEWEATEALWTQAQTLASEPPPAFLRDRIATQLAQTPLVPPSPFQRRRRSLALGAVGMASVVVTVVVAVFTHGSRLAFADVEHAMRSVRTAHWEAHYESYHNGKLVQKLINEEWARVSPPAIATHILSNSHSSGKRETLSVLTPEQTYGATSRDDFYTVGKFAGPDPTQGVRRYVEEMIVAPLVTEASPTTRAVSTFQPSPSLWSAWKSEPAVYDGRPVIRLRRECRWSDKESMTHTLWADPQTRRLVRSEFAANWIGESSVLISDHFRYDETLPENVFRPIPVSGRKRVETVKREEPVWPGPKAAERHKILALMDRAQSAWQRGNRDAFTALWDFAYLSDATRDPSQTERGHVPLRLIPRLYGKSFWIEQVGKQRGRWRKCEATVEAVQAQNYFPTSVGATFYLIVGEPRLLKVMGTLHWVARDGGTLNVPFVCYLRATGGDYRLIYWEGSARGAQGLPPDLMAYWRL